jgi:malate dehydrogenase (oxaloacetate-decarboxylating)
MPAPNASSSITMRVQLDADPGGIGQLTTAVEQAGTVTALDVVESHPDRMVMDLTCNARDADHAEQITKAVGSLDGVETQKVSDRNLSFLHHRPSRLTRPSWSSEPPAASGGRKVEGDPGRCPIGVPHR